MTTPETLFAFVGSLLNLELPQQLRLVSHVLPLPISAWFRTSNTDRRVPWSMDGAL